MSDTAFDSDLYAGYEPDISHLITEDDQPVDNVFSEKQMRLLTVSLHASYTRRPFVALANVGLFNTVKEQAIVPDVMLSCGVSLPEDVWEKKHRSYFIWEYGKPPDVVIEVVSNRKGGELKEKLRRYCQMRVPFYVVYDPHAYLGKKALRSFQIHGDEYIQSTQPIFPNLGLELRLWNGVYEDFEACWLRWAEAGAELLPTGEELAEQERERAEQERERAEQERERADRAEAELHRLQERLRRLESDQA